VNVASEGDPTNQYAEHFALSADGRYVAFRSEASGLVEGDTNGYRDVFLHGPDPFDLENDYSGDSDLDEVVLQVFDTQAPSPQSITLGAAGSVTVSSGGAAFLLPESASKVDRNSDGDTEDFFVHLARREGGVQDLGKEAVAIAMSTELIGALVPSGPAGETFVEIYDWGSASPGWTAVGPQADLMATVRSVVVLREATTKELRVYDAATAVLTPLGEQAEDLVLGERILAFRTSEAVAGDLNSDGDSEDDILQVYDLVSGQLLSSGQAVVPCRLQACDPRVPYRVAGDTVTFLTLEADQGGRDLNGDDDATDLILQTYNARAAAEAAGGGGEAVSLARLALAGPEEISEVSVKVLAGTGAGVCTDTGEACASDAECPAGSCFVPPGGCIKDLGTACACSASGCSGCNSGEFCVPILGGGGTGTCHENQGSCASDADCTAPAICEDEAEDIVRLFGPLAEVESDGRQVFLSAGLATEAAGSACLEDADCSSGEVCTEAGTCEEDRSELLSTGAPDTDGDGVVDPFDNCPHNPNANQADGDGDGVGDACNRVVCRDGIDNDGDGWIDLGDVGCRSADDPSEEPDCSDGLDNDGDRMADHPKDPGCQDLQGGLEAPQCQDGINNDPEQDTQGLIDYDGGQSLYGACEGGSCPPGVSDPDGDGVANPDPQCAGGPWKIQERKPPPYYSCGLGVELALLLVPLLWLHMRRRRAFQRGGVYRGTVPRLSDQRGGSFR
jgi:hypothetical protein